MCDVHSGRCQIVYTDIKIIKVTDILWLFNLEIMMSRTFKRKNL